MKLLIAGSRSIVDFDLSPHIPKDTDHIISGGANGIDALAEEYADKHRISKTILRPKYDLYSRAAPLKRNDEMVDIADSVLVIWDGASKGTKHTIDYANKTGKNINVVIYNENKAPSRWAEKTKRFVMPMCVFDQREKNYARAIQSFFCFIRKQFLIK